MPDPPAPSVKAARPRRRAASRFTGIRLGSISGFEISLDYSWFIIFILILASFTTAVFPSSAPGLGQGEYLVMGFTGALLFFLSLLIHELAHSFMARAKGIEVEGITLFIFGGMARTKREATSPGDEFLIAVMGPVASFALAGLFYGAASLLARSGFGLGVVVSAEYLGLLNLVLATFNLLPGFPLDGGRLLRATLWRFTGSFRRATQIAAGAGRVLGWALIGLGLYSFLVTDGFIGGLWLVFIGWFLGHAARMSYQQVLLQELLGPLTAAQAMSPDPETVPPGLTVDSLVHDYFLMRPFGAFPVTDDGIVVGLITLGQVRSLPRDQWNEKLVVDIMFPLEDTVMVPPETPMPEVLERLRDVEARRILVAQEWELLGIISATDVTRWLDRTSLME